MKSGSGVEVGVRVGEEEASLLSSGDVSPSSVLFLFLSLAALGEKKERMSCCLSFSNYDERKKKQVRVNDVKHP